MEPSYLAKLTSAYHHIFREYPDIIVRAPGRINLMGGHVDYNGGKVLPMAINRHIYVAAGRSRGTVADFYALDLNKRCCFPMASPEPGRDRDLKWADYIKGVAQQLASKGAEPGPCRGVVGGDLQREAGLASSAAMEVAVALAMHRLFDLKISREDLADAAYRAESEFVGVHCGIMDQYAALFCRKNHFLWLDCLTLKKEHIPWKIEDSQLLICTAPVKRALAASAYNRRREECEEIVHSLNKKYREISTLRNLGPEELGDMERLLPPPLFRRCRHVVSEMKRVDQATLSLKEADALRLGTLMNASYESLRDDYEVTIPPLDLLFKKLVQEPGVHGARLTGAGFGGCLIILTDRDRTGAMEENIGQMALEAFGSPVEIFSSAPSDGAEVLQVK